MATHKPVILVGGDMKRLPDGDSILGAIATPTITATNANASPISGGQPVYISGADAVDLAQATASATSRVAGLVVDASVSAGASGSVQYGGVLTLADWTAATGSATLTAGARYYLSDAAAGQLTTTAPDATGRYVTAVGVALSTTELLIEIDRPIGA